jgi:hypothetical protein
MHPHRLQLVCAVLALGGILLACTSTAVGPSIVPNAGATSTAQALAIAATAAAHATATQTALGSPAALALNGPLEATASGLYVKLIGQWHSHGAALPDSGINCGSALVLAGDQLTYDAGSLQQITDYVRAYDNAAGKALDAGNTPLPPPSTLWKIPPQLRWVQGLPNMHRCFAELQITNIGNATVEIDQVGVRVAAVTTNTYHYRLINRCSIVNCNTGGGGTEVCPYLATVILGQGAVGAQFQGPIQADGPADVCPTPLKLAPGTFQDVELVFTLAPGAPDNLVFLAEPDFVVNTSQLVTFPALTSVLAFADAAQFSCYDLSGNTFVPDTRVDLSQTLQYTPPVLDFSQFVFCI